MERETLRKKLDWISREENRSAVQLLFLQLLYLLRHAGFRKASGELVFGSEDPALTGKLLSFLALLYPVYRGSVRIIPHFDRNELHGKLDLRGHIRLIHVLIAAVRVLRNRELRELIFGGRVHGTEQQRKRTD